MGICSTTIITPLEWGEGRASVPMSRSRGACGLRAKSSALTWVWTGEKDVRSPVAHVAALSFREMHKENIRSELERPEAEDL